MTKKCRSSMAIPRGSANVSLSFSGSLTKSPMDPPDATEWGSSDLSALMDPSEAVIGASILSERGGLPLVPPGDGADVDGVREAVLGDHNAYLEGEGQSFPSPSPLYYSTVVLRLFAFRFPVIFFFFCCLLFKGVEGKCFTILLGFSSS